jgi:1-acyl-sn-glycerol-3-phosphate acyltransferase
MAVPFYRLGEWIVPPVVAMNGTKFTFHGLENIPERGGALRAQNHTSYLDWLPPLFAVRERGRRMYFMIKAEMADVKAVNYVINHARLIPVDRHQKKVFRNKVSITVAAGPPLPPHGTAEQLNAALRQAMNKLLYRVQEEYPHPEGEFWVPRRLGGGAPTQQDSRAIRLAELLERIQKHGTDGVTRPGQSQSGMH